MKIKFRKLFEKSTDEGYATNAIIYWHQRVERFEIRQMPNPSSQVEMFAKVWENFLRFDFWLFALEIKWQTNEI